MAKIYIGIAGEGRGHAIRSIVIGKQLVKDGHSLTIFTGGQAYEFFKTNRDILPEGIKFKYLPVLRFGYRKGKVNFLKTFLKNFYYFLAMPLLVRMCGHAIRQGKPDLVISDFEPLMARAAVRKKVPLMTIDHQQVIAHSKLKELPWRLRIKAYWTSLFVKLITPYQDYGVSSSFYQSELKRKHRHIIQVGPMLRDEVLQLSPVTPEKMTILAYLKKTTPKHLVKDIAFLCRQDCKVIIYGIDDENMTQSENLQYKVPSNEGFIRDLSACSCVITSAGNQLVGEAMWLGKPVLAMPEPGQWEQEINGFYVEHMQIGKSYDVRKINLYDILNFLNDVPRLAQNCLIRRANGNDDAIAFVRMVLNQLPQGAKNDLLCNHSDCNCNVDNGTHRL